ncbi:hypothetical protein [Bradyrhizobium sp. DOA1]|uniref:hypothetical protein n=1 Tax=Bradyrhizobium sp. DOA1 TaxID=1126616 RepID=UPI001AECB553|nr:hypothetical protein [Bradyrhizobium sp. DOA1]
MNEGVELGFILDADESEIGVASLNSAQLPCAAQPNIEFATISDLAAERASGCIMPPPPRGGAKTTGSVTPT